MNNRLVSFDFSHSSVSTFGGTKRCQPTSTSTTPTLVTNEDLLQRARKLMSSGDTLAAIDEYIVLANKLQDLDVLKEAVETIRDDVTRLKILRIGVDFPYSAFGSDWKRWRYYDDLSILAFYQKEHSIGCKAYWTLRKHKQYPEGHAKRIEDNQQFFDAPEHDQSYATLYGQLERLALSTKFTQRIVHFVYLKGMEFGLHHYLAILTAVEKMKWDRVMLYNDEVPEGEWWSKATTLRNVTVVTIQPPKYINAHRVPYKAHQADIIRLIALYHFGGVYMDLDMLTLKNFDELLQRKVDANAELMMCRETYDKISNAFIAASQRSNVVNEWLTAYQTQYGVVEDWWAGLSVRQPHAMYLKYPDAFLILPFETFNPFDFMHTDFFTQPSTNVDFSKSYGVHLWDTENQKRKVFPASMEAFREKNSAFYKLVKMTLVGFDGGMANSSAPRRMFITVEGNIGCGKSSLLSQLEKYTFNVPHVVVYEDIKAWTDYTDSDGDNILEKYYNNPKGYSYCFQSLVLVRRIETIVNVLKASPTAVIFTERNHLSDLHIFAKMLYEQHKLTEMEWLTYQELFKCLTRMLDVSVDLVVYLQTDVDTCVKRIGQRNRSGEDKIDVEYLTKLHQNHEEWLVRDEYSTPEAGVQNTEVLILDGTVDIVSAERDQQLRNLSERIEKFYA